MGRAAYPVAADLTSYLAAAGLTVPAALAPLMETAAIAGRLEFERAAGRTMLAGASEVRTFDPPTGPLGLLALGMDAATVSSVVYRPYGSVGETLTAGEDYWLEPQNAPSLGRPYERLRFSAVRRWAGPLLDGDRQSIRVTAAWGYASAIPEDAWLAMIAGGLRGVHHALAQNLTRGLVAWSEGGASEQYGVDPMRGLRDAWQAQYDLAVSRYRRWEV